MVPVILGIVVCLLEGVMLFSYLFRSFFQIENSSKVKSTLKKIPASAIGKSDPLVLPTVVATSTHVLPVGFLSSASGCERVWVCFPVRLVRH